MPKGCSGHIARVELTCNTGDEADKMVNHRSFFGLINEAKGAQTKEDGIQHNTKHVLCNMCFRPRAAPGTNICSWSDEASWEFSADVAHPIQHKCDQYNTRSPQGGQDRPSKKGRKKRGGRVSSVDEAVRVYIKSTREWVDGKVTAAVKSEGGRDTCTVRYGTGDQAEEVSITNMDRIVAGTLTQIWDRALGTSPEDGMCINSRIRSKCRYCGGGSLCQHQRERSKYRDCGGGSLCQHQREKHKCKALQGKGHLRAPAPEARLQGLQRVAIRTPQEDGSKEVELSQTVGEKERKEEAEKTTTHRHIPHKKKARTGK